MIWKFSASNERNSGRRAGPWGRPCEAQPRLSVDVAEPMQQCRPAACGVAHPEGGLHPRGHGLGGLIQVCLRVRIQLG